MYKGSKKKDTRTIIINTLGKEGPLNMWQIKKSAHLEYSSVHKAVKSQIADGTVTVYENVTSTKNIQTRIFGLTFKGSLQYLTQYASQFYPGNDVKQLEKELLVFMERQGKLLNYPIFQECRWLHEYDANTVEYLVSEADYHLRKPLALGDDAEMAEKMSKDLPAEPNWNDLGVIATARAGENENLMLDLGKHFLIYGIHRVSITADGNERLREFAKKVLEDSLWEIHFLENAVELFSKKDDPDKSEPNSTGAGLPSKECQP